MAYSAGFRYLGRYPKNPVAFWYTHLKTTPNLIGLYNMFTILKF